MKIVTGRVGEDHVSSYQMQAFQRGILGDFAILNIGEKLRGELISSRVMRVYSGCAVAQGVYCMIPYNAHDELFIDTVTPGYERMDIVYIKYQKAEPTGIESAELYVGKGDEATSSPVWSLYGDGADIWSGSEIMFMPLFRLRVTSESTTIAYDYRQEYYIKSTATLEKMIGNTYTKAEIDAKMTSVYTSAGNITCANLTSILLNADHLGFVYNITDDGLTTSDFVEGEGKEIHTGSNVAVINVGTNSNPVYKFDLWGGNTDYINDIMLHTAIVDTEQGSLSQQTGEEILDNTFGYIRTDYIKVIGGETITPDAEWEYDYIQIMQYDSEKNFLGAWQSSDVKITLKVLDNCAYIRVTTRGYTSDYKPVFSLTYHMVGNSLNELMEMADDYQEVTEHDATVLTETGDIDTTTGSDKTDDSHIRTKYLSVRPGSSVTVKIPITYGQFKVFFYDAAKNYINCVYSSSATTYSFTVPVGCHYVRITRDYSIYETIKPVFKVSHIFSVNHTVEYLEDCVNEINENVSDVKDMIDNNIAIKKSYTLIPVNSWVKTDFISVDAGDVIKFSAEWLRDIGGNYLIDVYAKDKVTYITHSFPCINYNNSYLTVPEGYVYVVFKKYIGGADFESFPLDAINYGIGSRVSTLESKIASTKSISGSLITLTDAAESNLVECVAEIEAVQEGSGDPSPTNIRPIIGQTEVVIEDCGKNLFDKDTSVDGYRLGSDGTLFAQSGYTTSDFIRVNSSTNYTRNKTMNTNECVCLYDAFHTFISRITTGTTFATTSATAYVKISMLTTDKDTTQLELGSTPTEYEPYQGKTYTIQLGDTIYGGELDVIKGKMVVDKKVYDLGDFSYGILNDVFYTGSSSDKKPGTTNVISSQYRTVDVSIEAEMPDGSIRGRFDSVIFIRDDRYTTASDFKAAMSGVQVCYEIKEPFTIDLTPQQIRLLKGTNNISCNTGDLSIKYQPDNALGDLLAEAEVGYDKQIEYIKTSLIPSRERNDITNRLHMLSQAVAEQNLEKYGYKIGDYFTGASEYTYILADYNTFKGTANPYCIASNNHLSIVVDTHQTSQWHSGNASSVGYNGSTLHTYLKGPVMDNIKSDMIALFGGSTGLEHLIAHSKLLTTALANWAWQANQYISALSEVQTIGSVVWGANGYQTGEASKKLEIFNKYKWTEIFEGRYPWLRDMQSASDACRLDNNGYATYSSVTIAFYVVGLINFY